jgi:oxygen-dependent protoporphyrinogen oxidase
MKIAIVGGGPAGCAAAYVATKHGHRVQLFEASSEVGGRTKQLQRDGFNLATGALFLMGGIYPRTMALLKEIHCVDQLRPWGGLAQLLDSDGTRIPLKFVSLPSYLRNPRLSFGDKMRVTLEALRLMVKPGVSNPFNGAALAAFDTGEDLEHWARWHLGKRPYEYIIRPIMDFLYAVPASWLSTPFPIAIIQQARKMRLSVPPGGVGQVSHWLIEHCHACELHLSEPVRAVTRNTRGFAISTDKGMIEADAVVVATESFVAADLLADVIGEQAKTKLRNAPYTDYAHVAVAYERSPWSSFPADIVLPVGADETRNVGAIVLHSRRHPTSVPPGGEVAGVYFNGPPLAHMSDEDIRSEAVAAAMRAFGPAPAPSFVHLFRYRKGLSIARPGHYSAIDSVHSELPPGVALAGDYFSQAGVEAAVYSGEQAALKLHQMGARQKAA